MFIWLIYLSIGIITLFQLATSKLFLRIVTTIDYIIPLVLVTGLILLFTIT